MSWRTDSLALESITPAVSRARAWTRATLRAWAADDRLDDAVLAVSELVTNAVVHGYPPVTLTLELDDDLVRVAVTDANPCLPQQRQTTPESDGGRGIELVSLVTDHWGADLRGPGKTMWCELQLRPNDAAKASSRHGK